MIHRIDRWLTELPPPSDPDPAGAAAVQELLGGRFGEMSTFMNYTFQSFNFRGRQKRRPVLRPGRQHRRRGVRPHRAGRGDDQHHARPARPRSQPARAGRWQAQGRREDPPLSRRRAARWRRTPSAAVDRRLRLHLRRPDRRPDANYFLETGARNGKLRVYEMRRASGRKGADRLPAGPRRRAPGRLRAGAGEPHWRRPDQDVPGPADPDRQDPRVPAPHQSGRAPEALPLLPIRLPRIAAVFNGTHPETGDELQVVDDDPSTRPPAQDLPAQTAVFAPAWAPEEIEEIAQNLREKAGG